MAAGPDCPHSGRLIAIRAKQRVLLDTYGNKKSLLLPYGQHKVISKLATYGNEKSLMLPHGQLRCVKGCS